MTDVMHVASTTTPWSVPSNDLLLPADHVLLALARGHAAQLVTGRHLDDVVAVDDRLLTIREHLRRRVRDEHGMVTLGYSVAGGFTWDRGTVSDLRDQQLIETTLRAHGLVDLTADPREMTQVMRGLSGLMRAPTAPLRWRGGGPLRFCVVLEFAEHLVPSQEHTSRTDHEMAAIEVLHLLGHSNALRQSGNLVIVHGREGRVDGLVHEVLHHLRLGPPGEREKLVFLETARRTLPGGRFERGLGDAEVARLTANTPNRGLELLLRASQAAEEPISAGSLIERKSRDVISMSEGTMSLLDVRRILGVKLVGRNIAAVMRILDRFAEGLLQGDVRIPANVLLAGPPSSGKTDCALRVAERARASAYEVHSPKGGIVGETERKARVLTTGLREWTPNVAWIDEITEAMPLQRSDFDGDSGASRAVMAALLSALSDESRRGRSLLIAATNCPWRMGAAMCSRFTVIPVLSPLAQDYPAILLSIADRLAPGHGLTAVELHAAAQAFHDKGATPREMRSALGLTMLEHGTLTAKVVERAARDVAVASDRHSAEYADLWAVKASSSRRFFPWYDCESTYPFPSHLAGVVNPATGALDMAQLNTRLTALEPRVNL